MKQFNDLTGKIFGKWTVLRSDKVDANRDRHWWCRCACGLEKPVKAMYLLAGTSRQCVKCASAPKKYIEELPDCVWRQIIGLAARRNIKFEITKQQAYEKFLAQDKKCALTGLPIAFPENGTTERHRARTASLDRIDSKKPYTLDNVQWVHKHVNRMKNVFDQDYYIKICQLVVTNAESK